MFIEYITLDHTRPCLAEPGKIIVVGKPSRAIDAVLPLLNAILLTWLQVFARYSPAMYVLEGTGATLLDGAPTLALWQYIAPLIVMGAVMVPPGLWLF